MHAVSRRLLLKPFIGNYNNRTHSRYSHCFCIVGEQTNFLKKSKHIPFLGKACAKLYTLLRSKRPKPAPCPAAHPRIVHMREYTRGNLVKITQFHSFLKLYILQFFYVLYGTLYKALYRLF